MKLFLSTIDPNARDIALRYGLGLEIAEYCTAWNMDEQFPQTDALVRRKLEGIPERILHGPFNELFPCAIDPKVREVARQRYLQAIDLARGYGAKKIVIHGGYNPWLYYPVWYTEQSVVFWKAFMDDVPEDVEIVLENVLEEEPEMLLTILRQVDCPRLGMCLDIGHVNAYSQIPVSRWIETIGTWIRHFHIHNNDGSRDSHSPLPEGTIPMEEIWAQIGSACPEATVTLELTDSASSVRWLRER